MNTSRRAWFKWIGASVAGAPLLAGATEKTVAGIPPPTSIPKAVPFQRIGPEEYRRELIHRALRIIGTLRAGETASMDDYRCGSFALDETVAACNRRGRVIGRGDGEWLAFELADKLYWEYEPRFVPGG
jgi:hypothetical protein